MGMGAISMGTCKWGMGQGGRCLREGRHVHGVREGGTASSMEQTHLCCCRSSELHAESRPELDHTEPEGGRTMLAKGRCAMEPEPM